MHNYSGIILGMGSVNKRQHYSVMSSLIGCAHTQNVPCYYWILDSSHRYTKHYDSLWILADVTLKRSHDASLTGQNIYHAEGNIFNNRLMQWYWPVTNHL